MKGRNNSNEKLDGSGGQIFYKKMKATMFDIGLDFLLFFRVSSWAEKDASLSVSVRADHLQGRPSEFSKQLVAMAASLLSTNQ